MGDWVLTAAPPGSPRGFTHAHLQRGAERVELRYCHNELADLAVTMECIEADFTRRCDALRAPRAETARAPAGFPDPQVVAEYSRPLRDRHA